MKLSQFGFRLNERFRYEYNFFDGWSIDIRFEGEQPLDPRRHYPRCVAGARRAAPEDSGGAEVFMERQPPNMPQVRKAWRIDPTLRRLAELLEDPTLEDAASRARSRVILRERPTPEFDRRAVNVALAAAFSGRRLPVEEVRDGDSHPSDH